MQGWYEKNDCKVWATHESKPDKDKKIIKRFQIGGNKSRCWSRKPGTRIAKEKSRDPGHGISDMDLINHILHYIPKDYAATVELLENDLEMDTVTLERVKEKRMTKFLRINKSKDPNEKNQFNQE